MKINIKVSSIVKPAEETPKCSLWNSNLDLLVPRAHIPTVYFYKTNGSSNFFDPKVIKEALSNVLVIFYPVAGRLSKDENGRFEMECNGEGVLFIEAESESVLDDFGDFTPSLELMQLVPTVDYSAHISSYPLLLLQVTHLRCGGVALGVGMHHTLADGTSALHFINAWSDMARGHFIAIPPFVDRTFLRGNNPPNPKFDHIEYQSSPTPPKTLELNPILDQTNSTTILKITPNQLDSLKLKAKNKNDPTKYSTYEIMASHVWRCACVARGLHNDQETKLYVPTDGRSRLCPPLPLGYFGNVVFTGMSILPAVEIKSQPLSSTVKRIHDSLSRMSNDYLRSALDYLEVHPDPTSLIRGSHAFNCPNLNIVSWIRLPLYDADFGWGRPIHMGPACVMFEGMVYILPSPTKDGSLSLIIRLQTHHIDLFKKLFCDMQA